MGEDGLTMREIENAYFKALRQIYDTKRQIEAAADALVPMIESDEFAQTVHQFAVQARSQIERLEQIFASLYELPRNEAAWAATAHLRDAVDALAPQYGEKSEIGCAAVKRYELSLYESLYHWSVKCGLVEALPNLRRSIAEEILQTSILREKAYAEASRTLEASSLPALQ